MKIVDQRGNEQEVFDLDLKDCKLYGQPKSLKKPEVLLGEYASIKRAIDVMAEAISINSQDKNLIYTMPAQ
ncbi:MULTISPECIES: hypothetical protein [Clostridium]|jgi:uncharacterized ubiquitin-like protein YukD|uniref:hypothetical protein n=1 Tax=Clostridium TaxID=1485 RepID=UPI000E90CD33|nr:hypothetical protein [Clostridium tyrobutyricum]HBF77173.1 hypothetical protein [Clostridiaceae bacterium]